MLRAKQSQATSNKVGAWLDSLLADPLVKIDPVVYPEGNSSIFKTETKRPNPLSVIRRRRSRRGKMTKASTSFRTSWF